MAVKENFDSGPESQRQFEREAKLLAGLRHPNLPRVGDHFSVPGQGQYLVMDFVEGKSLADLLAERGGPLSEAEALPWIRQVCDALTYLHQRTPPIIHRDIKPENIIITAEGRAILVDFGISKVYDPSKGTTLGAKAVTPGYSPPEQYGRGRTDARSDVYSLGATLYTLLTGQTPPEAPDLSSGADVLVPPRAANPAVSEATSRAVLAAMALSMGQRLGDAAGFEHMLRAGASPSATPSSSQPSSIPPRTQPAILPRRKRRADKRMPAARTAGRRLITWRWQLGSVALIILIVGGVTIAIVQLVRLGLPGENADVDSIAQLTSVDAPVFAEQTPLAGQSIGSEPAVQPTLAPAQTITGEALLSPTIATTAAHVEFSEPQAIAVDNDGNLYVMDHLNHGVQKYAPDGTSLIQWGSQGSEHGQFNYPRGIAIDADNNVYVADYGNHRIQKFATDGTFLDAWGSQGSEQGQFSFPWSIAVDAAGNVYVADSGNNRIQKFAANTTFLGAWGSYGGSEGQFSSPWGIAVDVVGNVYVADSSNDRIQKFAADGTFLGTWGNRGSEQGEFIHPQGISVGADRNIYVVDYGNHRIQKFVTNGTFLGAWGSKGSGQGQFDFPQNIAIDADGNVYVVDSGNNRIQKFTADGKFLTMWGGEE